MVVARPCLWFLLILFLIPCFVTSKRWKRRESRRDRDVSPRLFDLDDDGRQHIVNGRESFDHEYPFMVALVGYLANGNKITFCGAALLTPEYILTAAHCQININSETLIVWGTNFPLTERRNVQKVKMSNVKPHPNYVQGETHDDIMLIRLRVPLITNKNTVYPIELPKYGEEFTGEATVTGWGKTTVDSEVGSSSLNALDVEVLEDEDCSRYSSSFEADYNICAGYREGGRDACIGDSGGPLFSDDGSRFTQLGVVSFGAGCAVAGLPGVYTKVSAYIPWIEETTDSAVFNWKPIRGRRNSNRNSRMSNDDSTDDQGSRNNKQGTNPGILNRMLG